MVIAQRRRTPVIPATVCLQPLRRGIAVDRVVPHASSRRRAAAEPWAPTHIGMRRLLTLRDGFAEGFDATRTYTCGTAPLRVVAL